MTSQAKPRVLVLGTDRYLLRACVDHRVETVAVCGPLSWEKGLLRVPESVTVLRADDQSSVEAVLGALARAGMSGGEFDAVLTNDEWSVVTAAVLARTLGFRGTDPAVALRFRDKHLQKERIRAAGIEVARSVVIEDVYDVSAHRDACFDHAVLKPVAGAGTSCTSRVDGYAQLLARSEQLKARHIPERTFLLEELVPGDEWVADGVVRGGRLEFLALGRYEDTCLDVVDRQLPVTMRRFDPVTEAWTYQRASSTVEKALTALGLVDGVFHMELFHEPATGRLTFGECAARRGGALTQEEVSRKFGVDLAEQALLCALGSDRPVEVRLRPGTVGCAYVPSRPGTLVHCPSLSEVAGQPNVEYARIDAPLGTEFSGSIGTTSQKLAALLLATGTEEQFRARAEGMRAWLGERVVIAPTRGTARELREWQESVRPADAEYDDIF